MRTDFGSLSMSSRYMRTTSAAARLTKTSASGMRLIIARLSVKKCPDPVSAHARRGVRIFFAIAERLPSFAVESDVGRAAMLACPRGPAIDGDWLRALTRQRVRDDLRSRPLPGGEGARHFGWAAIIDA